MTARTHVLLLVAVLAAVGFVLVARERLTTALADPADQSLLGNPTVEVDHAELDALFAKMDQNGADVTSGHLVVRARRTSHAAGRAVNTDDVEEEMWFDGGRVRIEERETAFEPHPRTSTSVYDGTRLTTIMTEPSGHAWATAYDSLTPEEAFGHTRAGVGDLLMQWPLSPSVWGAPPRGSVLAERRVWLPRLMGDEQIDGLTCTRLVLLPRSTDPETTTFESLWVAPERGYAAARFERHRRSVAAGRGRESPIRAEPRRPRLLPPPRTPLRDRQQRVQRSHFRRALPHPGPDRCDDRAARPPARPGRVRSASGEGSQWARVETGLS